MTEQTQWKASRVTDRGNQYFHYPQDDDEFKNKVVKGGGWIAYIHKNGVFVDKIEANSSVIWQSPIFTHVIWQSPIFTHIKTTTINGKDIEQIYENCKFYIVPKGYVEFGDPNIDYWIFPSNPNDFDSIAHFKYNPKCWWGRHLQSKKANVGDIAFLYITKTDGKYSQSIAIQCKITKIDENNDKFLLELVKFFDTPIPFDFLQTIGVNGNIQGARQITQEQADFILNYKGETITPTEPNNAISKNPPLNQILYGPPGTGKTYSTIDRALEILGVETQDKSRAELKAKFDKFRQNGQIEFVTFHQSFSYEEFVEGIKPNIENENTEMTYEVKDGIFKDISDRALSNYQAHKDSLQNLPHKESNTKELFQAFAQNLQEQLTDAENGIDFNTPSLSTKMRISKIFYFKNEEAKSIAISVPNSKSNQVLKRDIVLRDYEKFKSGEIQSYKDIKPTYESLAQWHGNAIYYFALYEKIAEFEKSYKPQNQAVSEVKLKPYILIIDEINRGNISKILGELITLIEPSKRIGADEELRVTLPYSNESFGVPSNLYIIGTMNTADRSIALLDTALRRRFEFVEMMPEPELLEIIKVENGEINLQMLLEKINARIEFLLDREHTIGHSFFINVNSLSELQQVFKNKIIPLLQEYFYDDYKKIQAVLNDNQMIKPKPKPDFLGKFNDEIDSEKVVYEIADSHLWNSQTFITIYQSKDSNESNENE